MKTPVPRSASTSSRLLAALPEVQIGFTGGGSLVPAFGFPGSLETRWPHRNHRTVHTPHRYLLGSQGYSHGVVVMLAAAVIDPPAAGALLHLQSEELPPQGLVRSGTQPTISDDVQQSAE